MTKTPQVRTFARIPSHTPTPMSTVHAEDAVATLNADAEDNWTYKARHTPNPFCSYIDVYDEDGFILGSL